MNIWRSIPSFLVWLFWVLVAIVLVLLAALVIHHFGGFDLQFRVGHFHAGVGVT
jgi:hypothetical protein